MSARPSSRFVIAMVRLALAFYPARFRRRFEAEILQAARVELDQAGETGPSSFAAASASEVAQAVSGIIPQHRLERAHRDTPPMGARVLRSLRSIGGDVRLAVRSLRQAPAFTLVALCVLALGIGASTAIFSVVDAVALRGLPFDEHDRLAVVLEYGPEISATGQITTMQTFLDWRNAQRSFASLSAVAWTSLTMRGENGEPLYPQAQRVTQGFFETLRAQPVLGRTFTTQEESVSAPRVVAISHGFWQRHFAGARDVIGRVLTLNGQSWEVVAVLPSDFAYPVASARPTELYVPARYTQDDTTKSAGWNYMWTVIGRLAPGVSIEQAQEQMHAVTAALDAESPDWFQGSRARVLSLHHLLVGPVRDWMLLLLGSVALVLLIACANVANLMLARATVRAREMGIRAALGAGRWRITRMLVIEGLVLSLAGAAMGLLLAQIAVSAITASLPATLPRAADISVDLRVIAVSTAAAVITGVLFGLLPALQSSRPDITRALRDGGRAMTAGRGGGLRSALVVSEIALAVMLLVGAGLFTVSFVQLMRVDTGFDHERLLTFGVSATIDRQALNEAGRRGHEASLEFYRNVAREFQPRILAMVDAVRAVPGVEGAALVNGGVPLTGSYMRSGVYLPGRGELTGEESVDVREVSAGYLELLRVPLIAGRFLTEDEVATAAKVIVVNESAAARYWPGQRALGQQMGRNIDDGMRTIVGIVGDIRHLGPEAPRRQEVYVPLDATTGCSLVIRTAGDPMLVLPAVKQAVWSVLPDQFVPSHDVTLDSHLAQMVAQRRFNMALLALLGVLAIVIAAAGVYGVMAYVVSQRTQEIGVRMALGARPADVVSMVMGRAGLLVTAGLAIGGLAAWMLAAGVQQFLFHVASNDWRVFAASVVTLGLSGMAACVLPARRAARVDPLVALRGD